MTDKEMIREIQQGKKEYLNTIAEKYYDDIYRFCCYRTGNREDSYDLAQETFLKFIRRVDSYRYQNLKGYLLTIARNVCIDYFRSLQQSGDENKTEPLVSPFEEPTITIEELTHYLPDMQREAILLHFMYELKYREIAKITGVSVSTVKSRIRQGIEKIKRQVGEEDFYG